MILNMVYIFSVLFILGFICFSVKPSPIYGGLSLVVSGGVGCGIILVCGGSFLGLLVFLVYLGGMMVVFGYTAAMAMERYPDTWLSSGVVWGSLILGFVAEALFLYAWAKLDDIEMVVEFYNMGSWVVYDVEGGSVGFFSEDPAGVAAIYSYNYWLMFVAGWSMFVGLFIALELTR
ncbi:NADH dehydrogenase subunit 6 (mitochondrion) [Chinchilla lanigera]|uniref:NADH-ubiquinone oxidoreductase chain 6 n=1 Tax=Chinchilla lanigera TaxID=34839 RepID=M9NWL8_CHILA|nr:NADH dehydrogenase subunit 6 [Chinchilla lanigera]AFQ55788.1 NADH dehydrogenase subunit 6 [Chinchilla lanigera]